MNQRVTHIYKEEAPGQTRIAFISTDDVAALNVFDVTPDSIIEIWHRRWDQPCLLGTVHFARIDQVFASQNRATARLHDDTLVSLRLRAKEQPVPGAVLIVTITAAPRENKVWQGVLGARLVSCYGILLPSESGIYRSHRFMASDTGDAMEAAIKDILPEAFGFIIRRAAGSLSADAMGAHVKTLCAIWKEKAADGADIPPDQSGQVNTPRLIHDGGGLAAQIVRHAPKARMIIAEDAVARQHLAETIDETVDAALQIAVPLPHGGQLLCQRTHALWTLDLDSTGYRNPKSGDMIPELVMGALPEIARQIRLRVMGGLIALDMPRLGTKIGKKVLGQLEQACAGDPRAPEILGFTRGGLLEIRVSHSEMALADVMVDPIAQAALAGLRLATRQMAVPSAPVEIKLGVSDAVATWLAGAGAKACAALDRPLRTVVLSGLAPSAPAHIIN